MLAEIKACKCKNEYQDRMYGKGLRVHNVFTKPIPGGLSCTVCGNRSSK